jgi:predicted transcriptional regulator
MESTSLMFELSHSERLKMLHILRENPMRLSELSKKMDVTTAEVSRHMERLVKARFIEKNSDNYYKITRFGIVILNEFSNIDYLAQNADFVLNHNLTAIPPELQWFNSMATGRFIEGALEITSLMWEYNTEADKYIYVMSDQIMRALVEITCKKIDEGVEVRKIYPNEAEIPSDYLKKIKENHEIRTMDDVPLAMILTDKIAAFCFKGENGSIDFSSSLEGDNEIFRRWAGVVFDYFWKKAIPIL